MDKGFAYEKEAEGTVDFHQDACTYFSGFKCGAVCVFECIFYYARIEI